LCVDVRYTVTFDAALRVDYEATTDAPTLCNLTHHSYFNLAGQGSILDHEVQIRASRITPVGQTLIPTGELTPVAGTPFDFGTPHRLGERITQVPGGYDHNFVLDGDRTQPTLAARAFEPRS